MQSQSKIPLPASTVAEIIRHHFGSQRRLISFEELSEGYFNTAALLELDDGLRLVIKAAPPPAYRVQRYEKNLLLAEVEALCLVRQHTRLPAPGVVEVDTSRRLLESDYFLMDFVPGVPFHKLRSQFSAWQQGEVERQVGSMARQIAGIAGPAFGYLAQPAPPGEGWPDCFRRMLDWVFLDGAEMEVRLPLPYEELYRRLEGHFGVLDEVTRPRLVHWDLWDGNVFVDPATGRVSGLIDFERALWGDPLMEACFRVPDPRSAYMQGYGEALLSSEAALWRRRLYNAYLYLLMIVECSFRRYESDDLERWTRARLDELLTEL